MLCFFMILLCCFFSLCWVVWWVFACLSLLVGVCVFRLKSVFLWMCLCVRVGEFESYCVFGRVLACLTS